MQRKIREEMKREVIIILVAAVITIIMQAHEIAKRLKRTTILTRKEYKQQGHRKGGAPWESQNQSRRTTN